MRVARPTIDELVIGDDTEAWRRAGFDVGGDGVCAVGTVRLRLAGRTAGKGLQTWSLRDLPAAAGDTLDIDGIATGVSDRPPPGDWIHPNATISVDHLVLSSPDGGRTATAITAATGLDVRRTRDTGSDDSAMRQQFFRLGEVILELVSPPAAAEGEARFFGLAFTVRDLEATAAFCGEHLGPVKEAVQPGRHIATLRHRELDLSVPIAFMSPEPPAGKT